MDRYDISAFAHAEHPIAAPVSPGRVDQLVRRLDPPAGSRVVDLGCGQGAWLLAAGASRQDLVLRGVDSSPPALARARSSAQQQEIGLDLSLSDAATWTGGLHEAVLCVGASHVFGGLDGTLEAVRSHLRPGGRALVGDAIWEGSPSNVAQDTLEAGPDDYPSLADLVQTAIGHGFHILDGHVSTSEEWDDYEWAWVGALTRWALTQPSASKDRATALATASAHLAAWVDGYRGELGFACLVLQDARE